MRFDHAHHRRDRGDVRNEMILNSTGWWKARSTSRREYPTGKKRVKNAVVRILHMVGDSRQSRRHDGRALARAGDEQRSRMLPVRAADRHRGSARTSTMRTFKLKATYAQPETLFTERCKAS
jgi:hypothetical protein